MAKLKEGELETLMLEGLEPELTNEEQAIIDAAFDAELKINESDPVDLTPRERLESLYGAGYTKDMDDELVNILVADLEKPVSNDLEPLADDGEGDSI